MMKWIIILPTFGSAMYIYIYDNHIIIRIPLLNFLSVGSMSEYTSVLWHSKTGSQSVNNNILCKQ